MNGATEEETLVVRPRRWPLIRRALKLAASWLLVFLVAIFGAFGPVPKTHASSMALFVMGVVTAPIILAFLVTSLRMAFAESLATFAPDGVGATTGWAWLRAPWATVSAVEKSRPTGQQFICIVFGERTWRDLFYQAHSAQIFAEPLSDVSMDRLLSYVARRRPDLRPGLFWTARMLGG